VPANQGDLSRSFFLTAT